MTKEKVTLLCGCECGQNIKPRTPRKLQTDLKKSLSGNLFLNGNHFNRWYINNQIELGKEKEQTSEEIWESLKSRGESSMGNLFDVIKDNDSPPLGGHTAPTNVNFRGKKTKDKEISMSREEELRAELEATKKKLAELEADQVKLTASTKKVSPAELGTRQDLGSNTVSGNPVTQMLKNLYPNNLVVCACNNPPIALTPKIQEVGVWMLNNAGEKEYLEEPILSCIDFMGERTFMTVLGNNTTYELQIPEGEKDINQLGRYVKYILEEGSDRSDPHCYCCAIPIRNGLQGYGPQSINSDRPPRLQPKNWINTGTMTEHQLGWRYTTYVGPNGRNPSFQGTLEEYVDSHRSKTTTIPDAPKPRIVTSTQPPLLEEQVEGQADPDSDLPEGI